jgi:NAD(P)-dependent dehydrogenase (short-subunit alcohol dehydrogenase family)
MSMRGKVVVITGANTGVGLETAVGVAAQGATTVLACRNQAKAEAAAHEVTQRTWNDDVHTVSLDLADLASVRKAADEILTRWDRLDVLDNNAGGTWSERQETAQGLEYTMGVCHIAHFYLTRLLLDRLQTTAPSRVINVTSVGHHAAFKGMRFDDLQSEKGYDGMEVYCRAKLANVLFTRELARRAAGSGLTANTAHPGWVRSRFGMDGDTTGKSAFGFRAMRPLQISPRTGAKTSVYLATSPDVATRTGEYWVRSKPGHMGKHARDDAAAQRLWDESERLLASVGYAVT